MRNRRNCIVALWKWLILSALVAGTAFGQEVRYEASVRCEKAPRKPERRLFLSRDGEAFVWGADATTAPKRFEIAGEGLVIQGACACPTGGLYVLVGDARNLDWSSLILWFDPQTQVVRQVWSSFSDRWDGPRVLHAALARAGRERKGLADNDLTRLFVGSDGGLYFETEDRITYRATLEDGKLVAADVVDEVPVADGAQAERGRFEKVDGYWVGQDTR